MLQRTPKGYDMPIKSMQQERRLQIRSYTNLFEKNGVINRSISFSLWRRPEPSSRLYIR